MDENRPEDYLPRFIELPSASGKYDVHYSTGSREMPDDVRLYAEKELNETEENRIKGLQKLKDYIKRENLTDLDDVYLTAILRVCKYDKKKAETRLKKYLKLRNMIVKNIKKTSMEKLEQIIDDGIGDCLPYADKEGRPLYFARPNINTEKYDFDDLATFMKAGFTAALTYPLPTTKGIVIILDCQDKPPSLYFSIFQAYKKYLGVERSLPLRIRRVDVLNANVLVRYIFQILRSFLPSKISERIAFHGDNFEELHKLYSPNILPEELGGTLGPTNPKMFKQARLDIFKELRSAKSELT